MPRKTRVWVDGDWLNEEAENMSAKKFKVLEANDAQCFIGKSK